MLKLFLSFSTGFSLAILALLASLFHSQSVQSASGADIELPAAEPDKAHIIVQFGQNDQLVREISFTAPISGLAALELTSLEVITKDYGGGFIATCSIEGVGCPADDCFCSSKYWGYNYWDNNTWQGYLVGASQSSIGNGAIEGWRWGEYGSGELPPAPPLIAAAGALEWLATQQSVTDGGYGSPSFSVEALLAIGTNDLDAADWHRQVGSPSLLAYFMVNGNTYANTGPGQAGKLAVGMVSANGCWNPDALKPMDYYSPTAGFYDATTGFHTWAMLGTGALSQTIPASATAYLKSSIQPDGGWEWMPGFTSDSNTTAIAIQALIAAGDSITASEIVSGLNFLKNAQNSDGGFTYDPDSPWGTDSDTNSTTYAVQAILAANQDPTTGTWVISNTNPISYLLSMQMPDGSFEYQPGSGSNLYATQQAIPALLGIPNPAKAADLSSCSRLNLPIVIRNAP